MPHSVESNPPVAVKDEPMEDAHPPAGDDDIEVDTDANRDHGDDAEPDASEEKVKLEDLFDNMDDSDLLKTESGAVDTPSSSASEKETDNQPTDISSMKATDPEVMRSFYQRLFPWKYLFQWLNHSSSPTPDSGNREFAFTVVRASEEIYLRYQSYTTADLLRKDVIRQLPIRFEIGPVYSSNPRDRKTLRNAAAFKPLSKELCFDIDLTDYDSVRTCCAKVEICNKCWQFITMAVKVVDAALRDDFGFKHIMWVYSGRRGAHAWVCDKKARSMDDQKRRAIAGYLEVVKGGAQAGKKVNLKRPLHPHIARSLEILKGHFQEDVLSQQDPWDTNERAEMLLQLLPDRTLTDSLRKRWQASPGRSSTSKWADIDSIAKTGASKSLDGKTLLEAKQDIILEYTYPRLDIDVSKKLNHLLKSPFVAHPGTGRICVPIDVNKLEAFDPLNVPTVQSLLMEIDAWKGAETAETESEKGIVDWEKTSLKPYIESFGAFVSGILKDERHSTVKREREDDSMEF